MYTAIYAVNYAAWSYVIWNYYNRQSSNSYRAANNPTVKKIDEDKIGPLLVLKAVEPLNYVDRTYVPLAFAE